MSLNRHRPLLVAHRGGAGQGPENTIAAIVNALRLNVPVIEIDVQLSADRQLVLLHDPNLVRTTNSTGKVSELSAAQLARIDAGGHFHPGMSGEGIPTLDQAVEVIGGEAMLDIDIKDPAVIEYVVEAVARHNLSDRCWLTGINLNQARDLANLGLRTLPILFGNRVADAAAIASGPDIAALTRELSEMGSAGLNIDHQLIQSSQIVSAHHAARLELWTFTVNDPARWNELDELGIDAICTDLPGLMTSSGISRPC